MIKINKFLAASVVTLSLAACDLAPYSSIAVYANQAAKVVCDERYWVAARSGPGTEYELEHKLSNGKDITILEQTTGADGKVWYKAKYNLAANNEECVSYIRSDFVSAGTGTAASDNAQTGDASADTGNADAIQQNNEEQLALATASGAYATGTITGGNVYVRNAAGTSGTTKVVSLNWNHQVDIIGETRVNGVVWYNVKGTLNGKAFTGWTISTYIKVTYNNSGDNTDFVTAMKNAGFPDSYIPNLTALHNKYPSWTFEAVNTGLNWDTVIENESVNGLNLVSKSADNAKKSTAAGAYNWSTNTWVEYEPGWVSASSAYIAYLMDPRNFLDETNIFQFQSLAYSPNEALEGVKSIVKGTFMEGTKTYSNNGEKINYASTFMDVAKSSGVSAYHIASRIKQEQGQKGTSPLISGTYSGYEGYYNYFNFSATGNTKDKIYKNGLSFAKKQGWNTRVKSISGGAVKVGSNYINKGQNTLYFEKFNVVNTSSLYFHQYMGNATAALTEGQSLAKGYSDKNQAFVFKIPVYNNMPSSAVGFDKAGDTNNYLQSLAISGVTLTPAFNGATTSYSAVVSNAISSVTVSADAVSGNSGVSGTGSYSLAVGNNTIKVKCKSQSGDTRTYTININRQAASVNNAGGNNNQNNNNQNNTDVNITSGKYSIGTYITGIEPGTGAADFVKNIAVSASGTVKLLTSSGSENSGKIATGNKVAVYDASGNLKKTYDIVIYGDINGDGAVNALDMIKLNRHILGKGTLTGAYLEAADANRKGDGGNALDMIIMNRHILGKSKISQN